MPYPPSTFATLRALHLVIGDALDDIQRVFSHYTLPEPTSPSPSSSPLHPLSPDRSPPASPFPVTPPTSFPPTPLSATFPPLRSLPHTDPSIPFLDYPPPDLPHVPDSPGEQLALHPDAAAAASRIVAACGQISSIVHKPFLSICDAIGAYNLPACMRFVEHLHIAEILREGEENSQRCLPTGQGSIVPLSSPGLVSGLEQSGSPSNISTCDVLNTQPTTMDNTRTSKVSGMHITKIMDVIYFYAGDGYADPSDLVHVLRLLSTHHIFQETSPDTFALNRIGSLFDSGKSVKTVFSNPEAKHDDTDGVPAFIALNTDEIFKSAAYLTEALIGAQLPTLTPVPNASFSETATIPSTRYVTSDPAPCPSTTRSSSILTHIAYPEDENVPSLDSLLPSTDPLERVRVHSLPPDGPDLPLLPGTKSNASLSPSGGTNSASAHADKKCPHSGDATKPEKLLAFNLAFNTGRPFFEWLEDCGKDPLGGTGIGASISKTGCTQSNIQPVLSSNGLNDIPGKLFRLQRFSKAMMATTGWEAPKAILSGFGWHSLPKGSTVIDVGGGIGSTTMILARALNGTKLDCAKRQDSAHMEEPAAPRLTSNISDPSPPNSEASALIGENTKFRFVVQDRPVVTALGVDAWRSKCPEMLESGHVTFQDHDFFEPQPSLGPLHKSKHPAVYVLRVVLHDWPDECARRILINLRVASNAETRLLIAEHVLPLACVDEDVVDHIKSDALGGNMGHEWTVSSVLAQVEGAERALVPPPLLSNLGKASANAYSMDLIMHMTLNGKERTLREFCALALSAGWRVTRMTRADGSLFAYLVCEPIPLPDDAQGIYNAVMLSSELSTVVVIPSDEPALYSRVEAKQHPAVSLLPPAVLERSLSRCGTPTFGSRIMLPKDEELQSPRTRGAMIARKWFKSRGLGVRSVVMQKAEKQREDPKGTAVQNNDVQSEASASSSHVRVWWKKSSPNTTSNSSTVTHGSDGEVSTHKPTTRGRKGTLKSSDSPSTPSPRISPAHQKWPSIESVALPMSEISPSVPHARRPTVANITRKLSFATFRRPSIADVTEPLPTPPPSATLMELAPPPMLQGDTGRRLKHLPSLPTLSPGQATSNTPAHQSPPRRPSLSFARSQSQNPVSKAAVPRYPDAVDSPKLGILKTRSSAHTTKQGLYSTGHPAMSSTPASTPQRQRRMTLANAPSRVQTPMPGGMASAQVVPDIPPASREVKRIPSVPKIPHRLSIPMLRRKQSQPVIQDADAESRG